MLRKLLVLCVLASCCLTSAVVAAEKPSKVKAKPSPVRIKPGKLDKGDPAIASPLSCQNLLVYMSSSNSSISVSAAPCDHGYYVNTLPSSGNAITSLFQQSSVYGPDCTITYSNGATVHVQQNYCAAEAGNISASVVQGPAKIVNIQTGSYAQSIPGQVWVVATP